MALGMSLAMVACGSSGGSRHGSGPSAGPDTIIIKNFQFSPSELTVAPGTKVTVKNEDGASHTVTSDQSHAFDTGNVAGGGTSTFTAPSKPGSYPYHCTIHQFMHGTLTVKS